MSNYSRDQVKQMISSVMEKSASPQVETLQNVYEELSSLSTIIDDMHADIIATGSQEIMDKHVPNATNELGAVVGSTEEASASIMDACEMIQNISEELEGDPKTEILNQTTKIFEACSFQDITGQRITKVISTLHQIETAVDRLLGLFGPFEDEKIQNNGSDSAMANSDEGLMNGPQLPGQAISQDDIDKLLAEFD